MLGFVIAGVALVGLARAHRHHRRRCREGDRHGWRHDRRHRHGGHGPRAVLYGILDELDTTPGQEKEIRAAVAALRSRAKELAAEKRATRTDLAELFRAETFDEDRLGAMFVRHDDALNELRIAATDALAVVHGVLDAEQREKLAEMLASSRRFPGGPYR